MQHIWEENDGGVVSSRHNAMHTFLQVSLST